MAKEEFDDTWTRELKMHVAQRPIVILKLQDRELQGLKETKDGVRQFSLTRAHDEARGTPTPCICLFFAEKSRPVGHQVDPPAAYAAIFKSKAAAATFDSRLTLRRGVEIQPSTPSGMVELFKGEKFEQDIRKRLDKAASLVRLGPKESIRLIEKLLNVEANRGPLRTLTGGLTKPKPESNERLQLDAFKLALRAFGLQEEAPAATMNLARGSKTGLTRLNVHEDGVIEHDARVVPGYEFISSHVRGQATFRKGEQTLEVYTANRRKLEEAFGVDLIYLNLFHRNAVLVQYKMLEPRGSRDEPTDWVYSEDDHLHKQLTTMRLFRPRGKKHDGFRLSREAFYFKFVRRHEPEASKNVLLPLGHFEELLNDKKHRTAKGNVRVGYKGLDGRYMRQTAFIDLLRAGYIGSDASTTENLRTLIASVLTGNESLVVAVQRLTHPHEKESDDQRRMREWEVGTMLPL
ncbi:hypothetical protein ABL840_19495 [Variovorax sp. NFACC27]|uniref:hypothetical protein n=1 Tax=unclassified Variovorax TaxID=663243 RepID=UPI00089460EF|nr:hypothetical protein SAMN03159371_07479 [Variovorax sp. NFACC28]SEG98904.1 hypothetical protein SAMN03159365_07388 [Variovorax sp. NFACC29]SFE15537.1 hypothetical protein SAMN03159379_07413 [Variovorax sp. NFACC26]SFH20344.1 hypothetical protein SAMN03159447_07207 [Variovorax sp. NFACC27]